MLIILTLPYIALVWFLVRKEILKPALWVKLSPLVWFGGLFFALFVPMKFSAPAGDVRVLSAVIPIVPRVAGRVVELPVKANTPLEKGDVLFRIDPRPFQYQVDKLEASLAAANLNVARLAEQLKEAESATRQAEANLASSETDFDLQARESHEAAVAKIKEVESNLTLANANLKRAEELAASEVIAKTQLEDSRRQVEVLNSALESARAAERQASNNMAASEDRLGTVREQLEQARGREREARLAYEASLDGQDPQVRQVAADLANARWQLSETVVVAPDDGYVTNVALRPGATVASIPLSPSMAFVTREKELAMFVKQTHARYIEPGMDVTVTMDLYPGRAFSATVARIVQGTSQGQVQISGTMTSSTPQRRAPFVVMLQPGEELAALWLPPGSGGAAAVYTGRGKPTYPIRKVLMTVHTWFNFLR